MSSHKQKCGFDWNQAVCQDWVYTDPNGNTHELAHMQTQSHHYKYRYRDAQKTLQKGVIEIEVRYDPHCFTCARPDGNTDPALVFDKFTDGSTADRIFDPARYAKTQALVKTIAGLSRKDCRESRQVGKALYFKQSDPKRPGVGYYVVIKLRNESSKLVMFVETAHERNNDPFKLDLSDKRETYDIILGRLLYKCWPELLPPPPKKDEPKK